MRRFFLIAGLFMSLAACQESSPAASSEKLAPLLADLHLADAYSNMIRDSANLSTSKNYDSLAIWTRAILAKHGVSQEEFTKSMDWYRDRPVELDSLYARVLPVLDAALVK